MSPALTVAAVLLLATGSDPYIRSRVDTGILNDPHAHCLWWGVDTVTFQQDSAGNPDPPGDSEFVAADRALGTWEQASQACGHLTLVDGPRIPLRVIGWKSGDPNNVNVILYRMQDCADVAPRTDRCWLDQTCQNKFDCWDQDRTTIAITTTTYDRKTGQIYDADIEGNGASFLFTTVDSPPCPVKGPFTESCVATDVQNTLTHELGHALGLDHTLNPGSTMNPSAPGGETSKRVLDPGTRSFMCDVYPKGAPARDCVLEAIDSPLGDSAQGCSAAGGPTAALALLSWLWARRRRSTRA